MNSLRLGIGFLLGRNEVLGYFLSSIAALACDLSVFFLLLLLGGHWGGAGAAGFFVGSVVAYMLSTRWVFSRRVVRSRSFEFFVFIAIGCVGLLVVQGVMWVFIEWVGVREGLSRLIAVAFSFACNFAMRKSILFRSRLRDRAIGEVA